MVMGGMEMLGPLGTTAAKGGAAAKIGVAATGLLVAVKLLQHVPPEHRAVRTRFGQVSMYKDKDNGVMRPKIVGSGWKFVSPLTKHALNIVDMRDRRNKITMRFHDEADAQWDTEVSVRWAIDDDWDTDGPYKSVYKVEDGELTPSVVDICGNGLYTVLNGVKMSKLKEPGYLHKSVAEETKSRLGGIGISLRATEEQFMVRSEADVARETAQLQFEAAQRQHETTRLMQQTTLASQEALLSQQQAMLATLAAFAGERGFGLNGFAHPTNGHQENYSGRPLM